MNTKIKNFFLVIIFLFLIIITHKIFAIECDFLPTIDYALYDKWDYSLPETGPAISTKYKIFRKQRFIPVIFLYNFKVNENSFAKVIYDLNIKNSDGKNIYKLENITALDKKIPIHNTFQIASNFLAIDFEPKHKLGKYKVEVQIFDLVGNNLTSKSFFVNLVEYEPTGNFKNINEVEKWMQSYYFTPEPEKALNALIYSLKYFAMSSEKDRDNSFNVFIAFYRNILNDNKYLISYLLEEYNKQKNIKVKNYLLFLFSKIDFDDQIFVKKLNSKEKEQYFKYKKESFPNPMIYEVTSGGDLDILWATFFATGKYAPILRLVQTLEFANFKNNPENRKYYTYQVLVWSLKANYNYYRLVKAYCDYIYKNENLSEIIKSELGNIINSK